MDLRKSDPPSFCVQFGFGALFGALIGLGLWFVLSIWTASGTAALALIAGSSCVLGLLAGLYGDRFWSYLRDAHWWRLPF